MDNNSLLVGIRSTDDWSFSGGEIEAFSQLQTVFDSGRFLAEINASRKGFEGLVSLEVEF